LALPFLFVSFRNHQPSHHLVIEGNVIRTPYLVSFFLEVDKSEIHISIRIFESKSIMTGGAFQFPESNFTFSQGRMWKSSRKKEKSDSFLLGRFL